MLRRLANLNVSDRRLLVRGALWVLTVRAVLLWRGGSFSDKQRLLDFVGEQLPDVHGCSVPRAVWAITVIARRVPGTRCLGWALALQGLLGQARIDTELKIGVAAGESGTLKAHAWVECFDRKLSWGDSVDGYRVLSRTAVAS